MFAVIRAGGAQFKVRGGDRVRVSFMPEKKPKDRFQLSPLALSAGEAFFLGGDLKKASVTAEVLRHGRGKKILVFKKKRRKGYRKTRGHRQAWTDLRIAEIKAPDGKFLFQENEGSPATEKTAKTPSAAKSLKSETGKSSGKPVPAAAEKPVKTAGSLSEKQPQGDSGRAFGETGLNKPSADPGETETKETAKKDVSSK